jgi:hypothetical protein
LQTVRQAIGSDRGGQVAQVACRSGHAVAKLSEAPMIGRSSASCGIVWATVGEFRPLARHRPINRGRVPRPMRIALTILSIAF